MADEEPDSAPPTGTPSGGADALPGVAASQGAPSATPPQQGSGPGVLPPQGAGVPMQVAAMGDHAQGLDIMRGVMRALQHAIHLLGETKEAHIAAKMFSLGESFHIPEGGKGDQVDPTRQITQAIQARKVQAGGGMPPGGMPPQPQPAMPNRGPVPMGAPV